MPSLVRLASFTVFALSWQGQGTAAPPAWEFFYGGSDPGAWRAIFGAIGIGEGHREPAAIAVLAESETDGAYWRGRAEKGALVILTPRSPLASEFGFRPTERRATVYSVRDCFAPDLSIVWEKPLEVPVYEIPPGTRVFTRDRWSDTPLVAGRRTGQGAVLWMAAGPGARGYERFPYLLQALSSLGLEAPFRSRRLWAFLDSYYRSRVDVDYFAERWRRAGIAALHVAAWHFYEADPERDAWLKRLIEACHSRSILVYAWIELPHVSEQFWNRHPEWREKTALLQDAHLDWRRLMNLHNSACRREVERGTRALIERFDWDGVNLAELYFESLEGHANPARFTPMNGDVREEFRAAAGFDPLDLFQPGGPRHFSRNAAGLRAFLDYRAGLTRRMQAHWIAFLDSLRGSRPDLDVVLTHVDDRFDTRMRDLIGADAAGLLPLLERHDFTFLIEDPATIWHLGPERYPEIARRYEPLTGRPEKLAIDINIVERYQDVYPTKQQTGVELFQLIHNAASAFARVALYFEFSMLPVDQPLIPAAAATPARAAWSAGKLTVESRYGVGVPWSSPALVNGKPWAFWDGQTVWLPAGSHTVEGAATAPRWRLLDFNGAVRSLSADREGLELAYEAETRAFALLDFEPAAIEIDGERARLSCRGLGHGWLVTLPRGQHIVRFSGLTEVSVTN
jgi:hypothetical protein